jgi:hypothetical protein
MKLEVYILPSVPFMLLSLPSSHDLQNIMSCANMLNWNQGPVGTQTSAFTLCLSLLLVFCSLVAAALFLTSYTLANVSDLLALRVGKKSIDKPNILT